VIKLKIDIFSSIVNYTETMWKIKNLIVGVMVSMLASRALHHEFERRLGQTKD